MGYTHYWAIVKREDDQDFDRLFREATEEIRQLLFYNTEHLKIPLASWNGDEGTVLELRDDLIAFNGVGADSHESFVVMPEAADFEFCKTARKPYDLIVCVSLMILAETLGPERFTFSSDGRWGIGDGWDEAAEVFRAVMQRDISETTRDFIHAS